MYLYSNFIILFNSLIILSILYLSISISGSYSMSVDDAHYPPDMSYISRTSNSGGKATYPSTTTGTASATGAGTIGTATSAEKARLAYNSTSGYDLPVESFSMSSWSQVSITLWYCYCYCGTFIY